MIEMTQMQFDFLIIFSMGGGMSIGLMIGLQETRGDKR